MIKSNCDFEYSTEGKDMRLVLCGEVDHHSASGLRRRVDELLCELRPERVILDLSRVGFMDSSGLGFIMGRYSLLCRIGGCLVISDPSPATQRILMLSGIKRIIPVVCGEGEANDKS